MADPVNNHGSRRRFARAAASVPVSAAASVPAAASAPAAVPTAVHAALPALGRSSRRAPRPDSHEGIIQTLLRLPGFAWEENLAWVFPRENRNILRWLAAEVEIQENQFRPAHDQKLLSSRVAQVIEACCDEWLDGTGGEDWQSGPLLPRFWDMAAMRLTDSTRYWSSQRPRAVTVYKMAMAYTSRFDPKGRGTTHENDLWGFVAGDLTWGDRKTEIKIDLLANPWNAARDFHEYLTDTVEDFGGIHPPRGLNSITASQYALRASVPGAEPTNTIDLDKSDIDQNLRVTNSPSVVLETDGDQANQVAVLAGGSRSENRRTKLIGVHLGDAHETYEASSSTICRVRPSNEPAGLTELVDIAMPDVGKNPQASDIPTGTSGDAITVYGPRHAEEGEGRYARKITAVIDRSMPFRLILRFLGVTLDNIEESKEQPFTQEQSRPRQQLDHPQATQQAQGDTDDEGFQPPEKSSERKQNKGKVGSKSKDKGR